jgi:hypothetical protein
MRTLVETIDGELTRLRSSGDGAASTAALHASWGDLVKLLALGPKAEMRECPVCHGSGFRAASRCSNCWTKLEPLAATHAAIASSLAPIGTLSAAAGVTSTTGSNV